MELILIRTVWLKRVLGCSDGLVRQFSHGPYGLLMAGDVGSQGLLAGFTKSNHPKRAQHFWTLTVDPQQNHGPKDPTVAP